MVCLQEELQPNIKQQIKIINSVQIKREATSAAVSEDALDTIR